MITGRISNDIVKAAAMIDLPSDNDSMPIPRTKIVRPNKPNTTEGTPAKFEILILTKLVNALSLRILLDRSLYLHPK